MPEDEFKLSRLERYFLINQLRILEALYPDEADELAVQRESLERGYEMLYSWNVNHIYDGNDVMTKEETLEVWDTFDMFDALNRALEEYKDFDASQYPWTKFAGYDGNSETKFMSFAAFTVERLKRFDYLPMSREGYWNSHRPMREIYQRMRNEWKRIPREQRFNLSRQQVTEILQTSIDHNYC
ncbi:hypothetical protein TSH7_02790 [Azospirillum sp. TSH7]|uniref:YfbU family protein n=1 Tax=unclassified Azospirillum TaxID=2630922 RepID=UPI000D608206|nr:MULTISPECIES: YfbU family protein [unclassified Azospirillum]PWC67024.1 hypothetical protein TSH20_13450 [Azospirillum sp. TSH20]PWC68161.1 hypothetical protein TSH7_02790 [Azospirillum sp. TSH7]